MAIQEPVRSCAAPFIQMLTLEVVLVPLISRGASPQDRPVLIRIGSKANEYATPEKGVRKVMVWVSTTVSAPPCTIRPPANLT